MIDNNKEKMEESPSNSILAIKLNYIQEDLRVIKSDVKEIKSDFVTRREFEQELKESEKRSVVTYNSINEKVATLNKAINSVVALIVSGVVVGLMKLIIK